MKTIKMLFAVAMIANASAVTAKDMTCADYDRPDVYARFCRSNTDRAGFIRLLHGDGGMEGGL